MTIGPWYEFRDEADRCAAEADFRALTAHLVKKYHGNEGDAVEALREIVMRHPRLQALAVSKHVAYLVQTDPLMQQHLAKRCRRRVGDEKKVLPKSKKLHSWDLI